MSDRPPNLLLLIRLPDLPYLPPELKKELIDHCREQAEAQRRIPPFVYSLVLAEALVGATLFVGQLRKVWIWMDHPLVIVLLCAPLAWGVVALFNAAMVRRMRPHVAGFLRDRGRCVGCGYDLTATPEQCPECGEVPERIEPVGPTEEQTTPGPERTREDPGGPADQDRPASGDR